MWWDLGGFQQRNHYLCPMSVTVYASGNFSVASLAFSIYTLRKRNSSLGIFTDVSGGVEEGTLL